MTKHMWLKEERRLRNEWRQLLSEPPSSARDEKFKSNYMAMKELSLTDPKPRKGRSAGQERWITRNFGKGFGN